MISSFISLWPEKILDMILILLSSLSFDDILGQTFSVYIISIAGAESAIGLGLLVAFYRLRGSIAIENK